MVIEQHDQEIVIRLSGTLDINAIRKAINYFVAIEAISQNQGTEEQAAELAREVETEWWQRNKARFLA